MAEKSIGVFVDVDNLYRMVRKKYEGKNKRLDYKKYLEKAVGEGTLYRAYAYGNQSKEEAQAFISCLKFLGYSPKYPDEIQRSSFNWDVGLAMDVVRVIDKLDVVIIGSSDYDLLPLVQWIKEHGVQCNVFACNVGKQLKDACDNYIEITNDLLVDNIDEGEQ